MPPNSDPAASRSAESLFPLALTPFETYYDLDDSPEYPTSFPVELRFAGRLDRERFSAALKQSVERHPLLRAVIDSSGRRPQWVADARDDVHLDWADALEPVAPPGGERIDLRRATGLRTFVRAGDDRARVLFQFHHACCDGLASLQFVCDVLAAYKTAAGEDSQRAGWRELDPAMLTQRGDLVAPDTPRPTLRVGLRDAYYTARVWARILFRTPQPLAAPDGQKSSSDEKRELLAFETETLDRDETEALRQVAAAREATVNDLLVRDFLLALAAWNRQQGAARQGRLRINVPVSVRRRDERRMPVANRIGFGFVTWEAGEGDEPRQLLEVVRGEMRRLKERKLGLYFLGGLAFASGTPALLRWALGRERSFATAVLSNVGRFVPEAGLGRDERWRCGELVLESIGGVPPLRKLTRAAVIVIEYAGETMICLRCDPHAFDAGQTRQLLALFVAQLRETLTRRD